MDNKKRAEHILKHSSYGYLPKVQTIGRALRPSKEVCVSVVEITRDLDMINNGYLEIVKLSKGIVEPIKFLPKPR